jgi:hypothetical protein
MRSGQSYPITWKLYGVGTDLLEALIVPVTKATANPLSIAPAVESMY